MSVVIGLSHKIFMCNTIEVVHRLFAVKPAEVGLRSVRAVHILIVN